MKLKKVALVVNINTQFKVLLPIALLLKQTGEYDPLFILDDSIHNLEEAQNACKKHQLTFLKLPAYVFAFPSGHQGIISAIIARLQFLYLFRSLAFIKDILQTTVYFRKRVKARLQFLKTENISLLVITEDGVGYDIPFLIRAANKLKISSVVVPFTIANALEPAISLNRASGRYEVAGIRKKLTAKLFPKWVYNYQGKQLLRLEEEKVFAMQLTKLAPPIPWMYNSGHSSVIIMESEFFKKYHLDEGIEVHKMRTVGALYLDALGEVYQKRETLRANIAEEQSIAKDKKWILCALPPDYYPNDEFKDYPEMVQYWIQMLCSHDEAQVFVSLHPRTPKERVAFIEDLGAIIIQDPIEYFIPLCDIFVACISATIRMAVACKLPVVNYDVFHYKYQDYEKIESVKTVFSKEDFQNEVNNLLKKPAYYQSFQAYYKQVGDFYGKLDGKNHQRLLTVLHELTQN